MSRLDNKIIKIPDNIKIEFCNNELIIQGKYGIIKKYFKCDHTNIVINNNEIHIERKNNISDAYAEHGLYLALILNMIHGVNELFTKNLIINGVGFKVTKQGKKIIFNIGFSHKVEYIEPDDVKIECVSDTELKISGIDKERVGQIAASIKSIKKVDPYHCYGIRYADEKIIKKVGKAGTKTK